MTNSLPDITSEADIRLLVDGFYAKVVDDALLGPIFNDFAHVDWPHHLPVMYDFWSSLLLGTTRYHGRPFPKHLPLPIGADHFQRWLALFEATVDELFAGPKAEEARVRARSIATLFEHRLRERNPLSLI
ncbi:group III truncated hemoglobin [Hymenobacter arizonensis]|uniref:Hemoglobin n=1 Tax=Hymenobacter arizonensis TaxID=1227077 RepID=A0A1I5U2G0_HYMAR|nr:group III truncated hemoglobin [Hymenobacter arizonensis]SFP89361.1 hemoglobin [Hymenobacter arizonensis]